MKKQSGFTLIELIIVIVILGILAVTVAPQFFNFGSDARASTVRALEGSMRSASEMVYARGQIGTETNDDDEVVVSIRDGDFVVMNGVYAEASEDGIEAALQIGNDWTSVPGGETGTYILGPEGFDQPSTINLTDSDENDGCFAYYTWAGGSTGQPIIGSVVNGC